MTTVIGQDAGSACSERKFPTRLADAVVYGRREADRDNASRLRILRQIKQRKLEGDAAIEALRPFIEHEYAVIDGEQYDVTPLPKWWPRHLLKEHSA